MRKLAIGLAKHEKITAKIAAVAKDAAGTKASASKRFTVQH
jgi:hypothetical protein